MLSYWHDADANPAITTSSQSTLLATKLLAPTIHFGSPMPTIFDPRRTHLLGYANFTTKPIVECFSTIFTRSFHFNHIPSCLTMQKFSSRTPSLHRAMTKNTIFCLQTILHSSHVMCATPKSSHSFGTHELSLLLGAIFLH